LCLLYHEENKLYGRQHYVVNCYGVSVSHMTKDMFRL
jgi:hypothetical protein